MENQFEKVIVALDTTDPAKARQLIDAVCDRIEWFKIGPALFTRHGVEILESLNKMGKKVFVDLKIHDTPRVAAQTIKQLGDMGAMMASVHCLGGPEMLEATATSCRGFPLKLIGVTLLTSQTSDSLFSWLWPQEAVSVVVRLAELATHARLGGILCSAHEMHAIPSPAQSGFLRIAAGIRLPGEEVFEDDQKRVTSPLEALNSGADYIIVGRPLLFSAYPGQVLDRLFREPTKS